MRIFKIAHGRKITVYWRDDGVTEGELLAKDGDRALVHWLYDNKTQWEHWPDLIIEQDLYQNSYE